MTLDRFLEDPPIWLFLVFFAAVWWFVLSILARASGWAVLAEPYGDQTRLEGSKRRFQSIQMGRSGGALTNFSGVISFTVTPFALEISTFFPFSLTMKPLVIPLSDFQGAESKMMFIMPAVDICAARAPEIVIRISAALAEWIGEAAGARLFPHSAT
ncbi:MAG: hypothetical protein HXY21_04150 [Parvularculaceae bacterium]|nr:hypothetical protein [Parvularculaceae bacterium]